MVWLNSENFHRWPSIFQTHFACHWYTNIEHTNIQHIYQHTKFLGPMLETLTTNEYTINTFIIHYYTFILAEELRSFDSKLVMAIFDIESILTSIPLQEITDLCVENLFKDRVHVDNSSKVSFL